MLKAFSKVFHKTPPQGAPDDPPPEDFTHAQVTTDSSRQHITRASGIRLRQQNPSPSAAGLGIHSPTVPQNSIGSTQNAVVSPNRNMGGGGGARLAWPHMTEAAYPAGQPNKRVSMQHRIEQHVVQPRLHVKGPAQGTESRFALTKENLEWHMRMIPPVKESKYDRILKYIEMQQQAVAAAAADLSPQQTHNDIDSSLLMGGSPMHYDRSDIQQQRMHARPLYGSPVSGTAPMLVPMQTQQQQPHQQPIQQQPMQQQQYSMGGVLLAPPLADREITKTAPNFLVMGGNHVDSVSPQLAGHRQLNNGSIPAQRRGADPQMRTVDAPVGSEGDDDTPLAAINAGSNSRLPPPPKLKIPPNIGLEKYTPAAYDHHDDDDDDDGQLPEAVVPGNGFRASIASFQSNMAVNFNTEPTGRLSFSNSNPRSASILDSHYRTTPVPRSPTVLDTLAHHMSTNSGSAPHSSFPSAKIQNRPSLDAITPTSPDKRHSSGDSAVEASSPADDAGATIRRQIQNQYYRQSAVIVAHGGSDGEEDSHHPSTRQRRPMSSSAAFSARDNIALQLKHAFSFDHRDGDDSNNNASKQQQNNQADTTNHSNKDKSRSLEQLGKLGSVEQGSDTDSSVALRVVNRSSEHGSDDHIGNGDIDGDQVVPAANYVGADNTTNNNRDDNDDDDDRPLMSLPRPQRKTQQRASLYISTNVIPQQQHSAQPADKANGVRSIEAESDDDQPLSSLLMQPNAAEDDLGSLPLPMPRHVIDPDAVSNMDDMVNEAAVPPRTSIGERPPSPRGAHGLSVRKGSSLSRSFRIADHAIDPVDGIAGQPDPFIPVKRRSNLSTRIDFDDEAGRSGQSPQPKSFVMDRAPIIEGDSESDSCSNSDGRSNAPSPQPQADHGDEIGRPWARRSEYNPSTTSLGSHRKTQRGSTLGQQLTEEMHNLRMELALAQRGSDRTPRQSWQAGSVPPIQQPWLRKESALSDTALPHKLETLQKLTAGVAAGGSGRDIGTSNNNNNNIGFLEALAAAERGAEAPKMVSSWSFTESQQRPLSIQPQRRSRWFGKASGVPVNHSSNPSLQPLSDDSQQANHGSLSFSSRFNARFGKLKNTFKSSGNGSAA
ncbi:hypothetical protein EV175_002314 [Coemansia sp. RSA 1933]|nr:hypothetical protein EV175_002314 [Coemansia sp. RSA 1933]